MQEAIFSQCLEILKRDDIKNEVRRFFSPVIEYIFFHVKPYLYLFLGLFALIFFLTLGILFLLIQVLRNKNAV
jgi:hypothetical protein